MGNFTHITWLSSVEFSSPPSSLHMCLNYTTVKVDGKPDGSDSCRYESVKRYLCFGRHYSVVLPSCLLRNFQFMAWNISDIPSGLLYVPKDQLNYYLLKSLRLNELLRNCLNTYIKKPWISAWIFFNLLFTWRRER